MHPITLLTTGRSMMPLQFFHSFSSSYPFSEVWWLIHFPSPWNSLMLPDHISQILHPTCAILCVIISLPGAFPIFNFVSAALISARLGCVQMVSITPYSTDLKGILFTFSHSLRTVNGAKIRTPGDAAWLQLKYCSSVHIMCPVLSCRGDDELRVVSLVLAEPMTPIMTFGARLRSLVTPCIYHVPSTRSSAVAGSYMVTAVYNMNCDLVPLAYLIGTTAEV